MHRIASDRDLALRMGDAARRKVERELVRDRWNDVLVERIQELVGVQRSARFQRRTLASNWSFSRLFYFSRIGPPKRIPVRHRGRQHHSEERGDRRYRDGQ